jgi:DegV family protein with EDD domain
VVAVVGGAMNERRDDGRSDLEGEGRGAGRGPRGTAEEGHEDPGDVADVLVDEQAVDPILGEGARQLTTGGLTALDDLGAEARPQGGREIIEARVVQLAHGNRERDAGDPDAGVENLPVAAVARDQNGATALFAGLLQMLEPDDRAQAGNLLGGGSPQPDDLCEGGSEVAGGAACQAATALVVELGQCNGEVLRGAPPLCGEQGQRRRANDAADRSQQAQRQAAADRQQGAKGGVREVVAKTLLRGHGEECIAAARLPEMYRSAACILSTGEGEHVSQAPTVLVADSSDDRRRRLGLALYEGGYEVINAVNGEEALRFTAGLNPTLVMVHRGLEGMEPEDLHQRLTATGLTVPPFLILAEGAHEISDEMPVESVYALDSDGLEPERFLQQVRLLLLAREIGGDLSDGIDILYGDLTRVSLGDLLRVLLKYVITGHVSLTVGPDAGIWLADGEVIESHWGPVSGRKAFNRVAGLRGGGFVLTLEAPPMKRVIDADLASLVSDAVDERFQLDELFRRLPSLSSRAEVKMGGDFFAVDFNPLEREILSKVQSVRNLAELTDALPTTDLELLTAIESLKERGFLLFHEPEHRIHVVTDSICDLLPSLVRRNHITVVPLSVVFGKEVYRDGIDIHADEFYRKLRTSQDHPATSPPGKGEFLEAYRRLVPTGDIISIHVSKKQSLTAENAEKAAAEGAEEFARLREEAGGSGRPQIRVVDSWYNSVGLGMQVVFASRMVQRGVAIDDVVEHLESIRTRLDMLFVVDTLEYLRRGGRIGGAQAWIGSLLGIKPILGMKDGEVVPVDKVRGGRRVHPRILELYGQRFDSNKPVFLALAHASAPKWAGRIRDLLTESFDIAEILEGEIGPVVGTHTGPGCVGTIMFQPTDEEYELLKPE